MTASPTAWSVTPGPSATTSPANSAPARNGAVGAATLRPVPTR
ncbi:MAG: hypothetical protein R2749_28830 [Acidimicrobiales bacterium]